MKKYSGQLIADSRFDIDLEKKVRELEEKLHTACLVNDISVFSYDGRYVMFGEYKQFRRSFMLTGYKTQNEFYGVVNAIQSQKLTRC